MLSLCTIRSEPLPGILGGRYGDLYISGIRSEWFGPREVVLASLGAREAVLTQRTASDGAVWVSCWNLKHNFAS